MTTAHSRRGGRAVGLAGLIAGLVLGLLATAGRPTAATAAPFAQDKYEPKDAPKAPAGAFELIGSAECQKCHQENDATKVKLYQETKGFEFIRLWENKIWDGHDLHKTAYINLLTARSAGKDEKANSTAQRMEDNLRAKGLDKKYRNEKYTVAGDAACLMCHASSLAPPERGAHEKWTADQFLTSDGVGCEMCHGHGSKYRDEHQKNKLGKADAPPGAVRSVPWREWPVEAKRDWGLVNLRNAADATARCASCHIGNLNEGRFVTHEMYAAGHPPLPPLDLLAYTREQPRHWGLPDDMPFLKNVMETAPKKAEALFSIRAGERHVVRRFVESTVATLSAGASLTGQLADLGKEDGIDFAAFDCAACHHDLKYPSDRQARGYVGVPGRPLFRPANFALTKAVLAHAAGTDPELKAAYDGLLAAEKKLLDAFNKKALGDSALIRAATDDLQKWSAATVTKLGKMKYDAATSKALLASLVKSTQVPIADPEVAQLLMWGVETIAIDQFPPGPKNTLPLELQALGTKLNSSVVTRMRADNRYPFEVKPGGDGPELASVDKRIGERMKTFNSFQYGKYKEAFGEFPLGK